MTIAAFRHVTLIAGLIAAAAILPGCSSGGFDVDKLDVFGLSDKPKLPGERTPVFPEGVPGVTQGVPPDLIKGNQQTADTLNTQTAAAPVAPVVTEDAKPKPKPKAKPRARPKAQTVTAPPRQPAQEAAAPKPQQASQQPSASRTSASGTNAPWPSSTPQPSGANAPWPASPNATTAPWPSAPAPGTFSR